MVSVPRNPPGRVGIVSLHIICNLVGLLPQILLINPPLLVYDEGHDPGIAVICGPRNKGKTPDCGPIDIVVVSASRRMLALCGENFEKVAMERLPLSLVSGRFQITLVLRL